MERTLRPALSHAAAAMTGGSAKTLTGSGAEALHAGHRSRHLRTAACHFQSRLMPAIEDGRAVLAMERNGAEIVTTEMVAFEWLATAQDPRLREVLALVR